MPVKDAGLIDFICWLGKRTYNMQSIRPLSWWLEEKRINEWMDDGVVMAKVDRPKRSVERRHKKRSLATNTYMERKE